MVAPPPLDRPQRSQLLDDLIMGTNSSSITSKRSVERLYYPDEHHFFRYFVKKPQRRAPLINRGYWLRLRTIDVVVRQFIERPSKSSKKIVINLGCGSDVLPWQCHSRYGAACHNVLFVDVDYPDLMRKKREIVLQTPQLRELLGSEVTTSESDNDPILLKSDKYCQLACDLRELEAFRRVLDSLVPLAEADVLFVAEVSITYMDTVSADELIQWASSIGQAEFCLLEQILPHGPKHPFAKTMLSHFDKLSTPPRSVHQYPTVESQRSRFLTRGWQSANIWDLWEAWTGDDFLAKSERESLDEIEPFDEWEEFMLFGRHYFVLHATARLPTHPPPETTRVLHDHIPVYGIEFEPGAAKKATKRRFGNSLRLSDSWGRNYGLHLWGWVVDGRSNNCDLYSLTSGASSYELPLSGPAPRMCSTLTDLDDFGVLLVCGRASPAKPLSDCWLLQKGLSPAWKRTWDFPTPLFRHSAIRLRGSSLTLVSGGKKDSTLVSTDSYIFDPKRGWLKCTLCGPEPEYVFGAVLCNASKTAVEVGIFEGLLSGGITQRGLVSERVYLWKVDLNGATPSISYREIDCERVSSSLAVFGAEVVELANCTAICGGMGASPLFQGRRITFVSVFESGCEVLGTSFPADDNERSPLIVGASVLRLGSRLMCFGGGATCFSMGSYWNTVPYQLELPTDLSGTEDSTGLHSDIIEYLESPKFLNAVRNEERDTANAPTKAKIITIPRVKSGVNLDFQAMLREGKPVVIETTDLGKCVESWNPDYLVDRIGKDKEFIVHECQEDTEKMDFNSKNFKYVTDTFGNIMNKIDAGARLYLRSLSYARPSELPANLEEDFPELVGDFVLPNELSLVKENLFSSILRISGRINMWLHYDVMANVYTQIQGSKRMILFPPSNVNDLSFAPGASSSSLDVFSALETPALASTQPHEAQLRPGDVLLIPPMWLHTATPTSNLSVAVNVFFRDLDGAYSSGRDVYGNRDLAAYEKGRQDVARIGKSLEKLPSEVRRFYLSRLASELLQYTERN